MGRRATNSALSGLTLSELSGEIARRQKSLPALMRRRAKALTKVRKIDALIAGLGGEAGAPAGGKRGPYKVKAPGAPKATGRKRPKNEKSLPEAIADVLKGKTMGVPELAEAVKAAGYKTNAKNFRVMVNHALSTQKKFFKKVERGQYTTV